MFLIVFGLVNDNNPGLKWITAHMKNINLLLKPTIFAVHNAKI